VLVFNEEFAGPDKRTNESYCTYLSMLAFGDVSENFVVRVCVFKGQSRERKVKARVMKC